MASSGSIQTRNIVPKRVFTKEQKNRLIQRFKNEMIKKESEFPELVEKEIKLMKLKFNNRLNKILRKFWDIKLGDILNVEREIKDSNKVNLVYVLKQLDAIKKQNDISNDRNSENNSDDKDDNLL